MAETRIVGFDGAFALPTGYGGRIKSWSARAEVVNTDTSAFADTVAQNRNGLLRMSGSATGTPYKGVSGAKPGINVTALQGNPATITITSSSGCTYAASANITAISLSSDHQGEATISFDWIFTGAITETWAES